MTSRRALLSAASAAAIATALPYPARAQGKADCKTCRGVGLVPLKNPKPYVFVEGMPAPKPKEAVPAAWCGECQKDKDPAELVEKEAERLKTIQTFHKLWEKNYVGLFTYVETRHVALHSLFDARLSQQMGLAVENLCAHLQKLTGTMELTLTRPSDYNLFALWEKLGWERFRAAMKKHLPPEKLGEGFEDAKDLGGYHHLELSHFYESPRNKGGSSPVHGALSFFGYEQIERATKYLAPHWLTEGFSAYCEYAVLKAVRWYSIYQPEQSSALGDSLAHVRQLAAAKKLRELDRFLRLEIRDYETDDYPQAFGIVHFLLNKWPVRFLDYVRLLKAGGSNVEGLEQAFEQKLPEIEKQWREWALTAR